MKRMVMLDYMFIFEPDATWARLSEFEQDLADFFAAYGLQVEKMDTIRGQADKQVVIVKRLDKMFAADVAQQQAQVKQQSPAEALDKMQEKLQLAARPPVK